MDRRPLSNTGETIPSIGIGTWRYLGDPLVLQKAIELGANLIDTAEAYETEEFVGKAISGIRTQCFIATKVSGQNLPSLSRQPKYPVPTCQIKSPPCK